MVILRLFAETLKRLTNSNGYLHIGDIGKITIILELQRRGRLDIAGIVH